MADTVGIGIIGCGGRVLGIAQKLKERSERLCFAALCDPNPVSIERGRERLNPEAHVYEDFQDLVHPRWTG